MKLKHHIALSTIISGVLFVIYKSWGLSIASFVSGIFTDIDHTYDYIAENGFHLDKRVFFEYFYREKHERITLILHGWEWLLCFSLAALISGFNTWAVGLLIGYGHHIVSDYLYSRASWKTYSMIWRWRKGFESKKIFPRDRGYRPKI